MYSHDGGPVLLYPQQPPPPPPLCSFVHIVPQYTMVEYPPQPSPLVFTPGRGAFLEAAAKEVRAEVRDVWAGNFDDELSNLSAVLPH